MSRYLQTTKFEWDASEEILKVTIIFICLVHDSTDGKMADPLIIRNKQSADGFAQYLDLHLEKYSQAYEVNQSVKGTPLQFYRC